MALAAICLGYLLTPIVESDEQIINSDWPSFATGARLAVENPAHLYDLDAQRRVELEITGGRQLVTLGIQGILPFLGPPWVALLAIPFLQLGVPAGGRAWILGGLLALAGGLWLALKRGPPEQFLPAFAAVPTALILLNAQLDGLVVLGLGTAYRWWRERPLAAGFALGLTLVKPHLVLPVGFALLLGRRWRLLGGWAAAGLLLAGASALRDPAWVLGWLGPATRTVQQHSREIALADLAPYLAGPPYLLFLVAGLAVAALAGVLYLAWYSRQPAVLVAGGVLAAPHALPADLALIALALVIWGRAGWLDWLLLSLGTAAAALLTPPLPALAGVLLAAGFCLRVAGLSPRLPRRPEGPAEAPG